MKNEIKLFLAKAIAENRYRRMREYWMVYLKITIGYIILKNVESEYRK